MIGKIERVPLRKVWQNEAIDFTTWLAQNLDVLYDVVDGNLTLVEIEKSVGSFNVDILAEDSSGNSVIIENQLEKTDHDHLGKLITYATNLDAKTAIWITPNPRQEHITAITWLNEYTPMDFYLLRVEAIAIDDSKPAPLFYKIAGPSEGSKEIGNQKKELSARHHKRRAFWESLLEKSKDKTVLFANVSPSDGSWISTGIGLTGLQLDYVITYDNGVVELYIDKSSASEDINKKRFDYLYSKKDEIEKSVGEPLTWDRLDNKRACKIRRIFASGLRNEEKWDELQEQMIEFMIKFEKTIKKYISDLRKLDKDI